jgi:hypothetical protein
MPYVEPQARSFTLYQTETQLLSSCSIATVSLQDPSFVKMQCAAEKGSVTTNKPTLSDTGGPSTQIPSTPPAPSKCRSTCYSDPRNDCWMSHLPPCPWRRRLRKPILTHVGRFSRTLKPIKGFQSVSHVEGCPGASLAWKRIHKPGAIAGVNRGPERMIDSG